MYLCKFLGSFNDASIFMSSDLYQDIMGGTLNIPEPTIIEGTDILMPYFFVADSIFALHRNIMKPYTANEHTTQNQSIYNYRISRARINIECAFGILVSRWRIFDRPLSFSLRTTELIIIAAMFLHNFLISEDMNKGKGDYVTCLWSNEGQNLVDREEDEHFIDCHSESQRKKLMEYFCSEKGSVPWQKQ